MGVFIIAEAGVNHNGSLELARQLVRVAKDAGADAVKFQTFKASEIVSAKAPKAEYQTTTTGSVESQFEMVRKLELGVEEHRVLSAYAQECGIEFMSTPFDAGSVDLLVDLGVSRLKVPSGDVTNAPLLLKMARAGLPLIVSTGMTTIEEIEAALGVIAFGLLRDDAAPNPERFSAAYRSPKGRELLATQVSLLHCTTEYPAPLEEVNLRALEVMRERFQLPVGYSDHTEGITVSIAAAGIGATIIEKHFTLDRSLPGPDHRASLEPGELAALVKGVQEASCARGAAAKEPTASERKNMAVARRSLVARAPIAKGELFSEANLGVKRPGTGLSPYRYWELLGTPSGRAYDRDDLIADE